MATFPVLEGVVVVRPCPGTGGPAAPQQEIKVVFSFYVAPFTETVFE